MQRSSLFEITLSSAEKAELRGRAAKYIGHASATSVATQTNFNYCDAAAGCSASAPYPVMPRNSVITAGDLITANDRTLQSMVAFDGLGRDVETRKYEGSANYISVQKQRDALGRISKVSNPLSSGTVYWTTTDYYALSRPITVTTAS